MQAGAEGIFKCRGENKMKTLWIKKSISYDGSQLRPLFAYLEHGIMGDSVVAFRGPCKVDFKNMIDGEDLLAKSEIQGSNMLHFIFEIFDRNLITGVFLQRLFASIVIDVLHDNTESKKFLREGDDIYYGKKKLSISIASNSSRSTMIHFAVNISNKGTPVPTCSLSDFSIEAKDFANECLRKIQKEYVSICEATVKVRPL